MRFAAFRTCACVAAFGASACSLTTDTDDLARGSRSDASQEYDAQPPADGTAPGDAAEDATSDAQVEAGMDATLDAAFDGADDAIADAPVDAPLDAADAADASPLDYRSTVLADTPLAYWRLDETVGTTAHDSSGHGNSASLGTTGAWGAGGALVGDANTALHLDGTDGLDAGQLFDFAGVAPYTLEAWVKADAIDSTYRHLFSKNDESRASGREEYGVFLQTAEGLVFERFIGGTSAKVGTALPALGAWTHVVSTYDGAKMALYVNGAIIATRADARAQLTKPVDFFFATKQHGDGVIKGTVDEIAVYDHALAADRVTAHWAASKR